MGTSANQDRVVKVRGLLFDAQGRLLVASSGGGGGGGGGGTVDQGAAGSTPWLVNADPTNRFAGGKTPVCETVTAEGDTTLYTPAAGNAVTLWWVSAINDPDEATTPLVKVLIGALECYRSYALAHWEPFTGEVDEPLVVNLSAVGSVAVTAHVTEGAP